MNEDLKRGNNPGGTSGRGGKRLARNPREAEGRAGSRLSDTVRLSVKRIISAQQSAAGEEPQALEEKAQPRSAAAATQEAPVWQDEAQEARPPRKKSLAERVKLWSRGDDEAESPFIRFYQAMRQRIRGRIRHWRYIIRENRARNFPESERMVIQLALFVWNLVPMLGAHLRERLDHRRRRGARKSFPKLFGGKKIHPAAFLGAGCGFAAVVLFFSFYTVGTTVTYDGQVVAAVSSRSAAEAACQDLEAQTTSTLGENWSIDASKLTYSTSLLPRQEVVDGETFEEDLSDQIGLVTQAYCLYVDGELIGATPYEGALEELLQQLKDAATNENTISCEFAEDVEVKYEYVPNDQVMNLGYLAETLYSTKTAEVTYTVVKGDTWSEIAEDHGLTSAELLALNPGYNIDKLQIGEVLTLSASVPYLTMTVQQREYYVDEIPYDIEYTDSAYLYKGDYKVTSAGEYGAADVVANVTYVNGEETQRTILSSVTLKEPVTEQRLQGTKERPTWLPTGTFRWPTSGRITSYFGGRSSPGGIGSTNHKGIDIAGSYGTPIYAADGGTVTYAGWMGGYGYLVQISHGNGYVTYYGHNSSLLVSVGDHVYKGQQIARMGSTGNSTGNHCHFEVRYNGVAKNPLNYLP
jgi:murein DD-endopeptidase MepM/ murein hydrolase activator NlpD|nr:peptidoglycan DD-metalloendopeptidase family protein [uncultured Oscillibacter sp.]